MVAKEIRKMDSYTARALAIKQNWFTRADNSTYEKWLNMADSKENLTTADIIELAKTVKEWSDFEHLYLQGETDTDILEHICFEITKYCTTIFEIKD